MLKIASMGSYTTRLHLLHLWRWLRRLRPHRRWARRCSGLFQWPTRFHRVRPVWPCRVGRSVPVMTANTPGMAKASRVSTVNIRCTDATHQFCVRHSGQADVIGKDGRTRDLAVPSIFLARHTHNTAFSRRIRVGIVWTQPSIALTAHAKLPSGGWSMVDHSSTISFAAAKSCSQCISRCWRRGRFSVRICGFGVRLHSAANRMAILVCNTIGRPHVCGRQNRMQLIVPAQPFDCLNMVPSLMAARLMQLSQGRCSE